MSADAISCTAEGTNVVEDRIVLLRSIHVHYVLEPSQDAEQAKVERALETHVDKCPTARSLRGAVDVTWSADLPWGRVASG
jgi:uncharacterized OsmC-like protein